MRRSAKRHQPSLLYVFVTLFLATFLLLFTIWREPGTLYEAAAEFETTATPQELSDAFSARAILTALHHAEMVRGAHPDLLRIAEEIADRMHVEVADRSPAGKLTLRTRHPEAAIKLLDTLVADIAHTPESVALVTHPQPTKIVGVRGGSVRGGQLSVLSVLASIIALCGVVFSSRAHACKLLLTRGEVERATGLPVVTELTGKVQLPEKTTKRVAERRFSSVALWAAELTVAGVFLLMVYQLATESGLPSRFLHDPLAAYGEVLTEVIG